MKAQGRLVKGFESILKICKRVGATPVFVLDGAADKAKAACLKTRRDKKDEGIEVLREKKAEFARLREAEPKENVEEMKI